MMGKFNFNESPVVKVAEEVRENRVEQPISTINQQMQQVAQPAAPVEEALKGISVKIPYAMYDALDAIKKRTQRTGDRRDKMGIGDLVVQAVKEYVERNKVE